MKDNCVKCGNNSLKWMEAASKHRLSYCYVNKCTSCGAINEAKTGYDRLKMSSRVLEVKTYR